MRRELRGSMVFDAGVLIELLLLTPGGVLVREALLRNDVFGYATELALVEAKYVLCRKFGWEEAARRVNHLALSGFIQVEGISPLCERAAELKCKMAIALPDCFTLSLAEMLCVPALFARRERELVKALSRASLDIEVLFLEDYVLGRRPDA